MPIKSQMSSNMGQIKSEHPKLFALEFGKITESDFVYTLASTNINCGVRGHEVEHRPCNHEVPSSSLWSGSQLWVFSLAHTFGASTGVVPRKQNLERLV